jgi:hypothetical protein
MDRKEKKGIHLKIVHLLDQNCANCEFRSIKNSHTYCKENCLIGQELYQLASKLVSSDKEEIQSVAKQEINKEPVKKGRWSSEEETYLINHYKLFTQKHLANRLNRSKRDVYNKIYNLKKMNKITS